jgi:hypothetical protein
MRKALAAVGLLVVAATLVRGEKEIEPDALLGHIKFLAADDLKGRGNGSEGLERAADYIAEQFKSAGLQPGVSGNWFQPFELNAGLSIGPTNTLSFQSRGRIVTLTLGTSYYPLAASGSDKTPSVKLDKVPLGVCRLRPCGPRSGVRRLQEHRRVGQGRARLHARATGARSEQSA